MAPSPSARPDLVKTYHIFTFDLWRCTPVRRLSRRGRVGIPIPCARPTRAAQQKATRRQFGFIA